MRRLGLALLGLAVVLVALNTLVTTRAAAPARADVGRVLQLEGPDLQVREDGRADGAPIVFLHGFASSIRAWERLRRRLAARYRLVQFDLLGHGGSEKPRERDVYDYERQARSLHAALRRLGVERALVVAHSAGGLMAGALAERARGRVSGVVLLGTAPHPAYRKRRLVEWLVDKPLVGPFIHRALPDAAVRNSLRDVVGGDEEVPDSFVDDYQDMTYSSFASGRDAADDYARESALDDRLARLRLPVLVVFGDEDGRTETAGFDRYRDVPRVEMRELRGVGHSPQWQVPARTAALISGFQARAGAAR